MLFVLDRGVRKFPGDLSLWMQYVDTCRKAKAHRKVADVLTRMLRLFPKKGEMWTYAASWAMEEQGDMTAARSYMQRGLRFCKSDRELWIEYGRLEMVHAAKIAGRARILGIDGTKKQDEADPETADDDHDADEIKLPQITGEDVNPNLREGDAVDEDALQTLAQTPALTGAIPMAVFDEGMKQFGGNPSFGLQFFDMIAEFASLTCTKTILQHILDHLRTAQPKAPATHICDFRAPLVGVDATSADFPAALSESLQRMHSSMQQIALRKQIAEEAVRYLQPFAEDQELDEAVQKALSASLKRLRASAS